MKNNLKGGFILALAALIWGTTFVAQEEAARYIGSFTLNCLRSFVGFLVLIPVVLFLKNRREKKSLVKERLVTKHLILGGVLCGLMLSIAANLQQIGIIFNAELAEGDSGKAGFITAMYIIFVPIISVIGGKRLRLSLVVAVLVAVFGLYFISVKQGFSISSGDVTLLLCALAFSGHIILVDHFVEKTDGVALSCLQFLVAGIVSGILMLLAESDRLSFSVVFSATIPILYCGVLSSGIAYTLQIVGQKYSEPSVASLVMSLESLFAMIAACIFYRKLPTLCEGVGCVLMMVAIFIVETPYFDNMISKLKRKDNVAL